MKKTWSMLLALLLLVGLTGCQKNQQAETDSGIDPIPTTEATEPTQAPTTEATEPDWVFLEPEVDGDQRHYYRADGTKFCTQTLDSSGRLIRREAYRNDALYLVWEYEYEDSGNLDWVECLCDVDSDEWISQYGGNSMVTQVTDQGVKDTFYEDGIISAVVSYSMDWVLFEERYADGLPVYSCQYDADDLIVTQTQYENGVVFWVSSRMWEQDTEYVMTAFYDEQGRVVQQFHYQDWEERSCRNFTYDENGNLLDETTETPTEKKQVNQRRRNVYGDHWMRTYDAYDGLVYQANYDEQGRIRWESFGEPYGRYSEFGTNTEYRYNEDGSYTTVWVGGTGGLYYGDYDKNGNLLDNYGGQDPGEEDDLMQMEEWSTYSYNEYGDNVRYQCYFYGELSLDCQYEYQYDENGRWIEMTSYTDGVRGSQLFRSYDQQGRLIQETDENGVCCDTYTYDEAGNLIEKRQMTGIGGNLYTYVYDEAGRVLQENWYNIEE